VVLARRWVVIVVVVIAAPRPSQACTPGESPTPTNLELVVQTDAIVVARATAYDDARGVIQFQVGEVVKGTKIAVRDALTIRGMLETRWLRAQLRRVPGAPHAHFDFAQPREGAWAGSCVARDFKLGTSYLLFLEHGDAGWDLDGHAFTRVSEPVDPAGDPWLTAVAAYARISQLPASRRAAALQALRDDHATPHASAGDRAIVEDVERHFAIIAERGESTP
jgi:hypothetical protein